MSDEQAKKIWERMPPKKRARIIDAVIKEYRLIFMEPERLTALCLDFIRRKRA